MKISYNWLKRYVDFNLTPTDLAEILTNTGLEVEDITPFESVKGGLKEVVIGEIVSCEKHPDADKLQITKVNVGQPELLQIVCGAPNCRVGLKSPIALVGAVLHPFSGEKFQIKKAKIRGVESMGMICAADELGLGESHAGIMELPTNTAIGTPAADFFKVENDTILEIGLTPNRSDAFSHIGVARDLVAALMGAYKVDLQLKKPSTQNFVAGKGNYIRVASVDETACKRYAGLELKGLKVAESPTWLKNCLLAIGVRPINNIVDCTNFVLHEYGQPLHAFDAEKINGQEIKVGFVKKDTPFITLDKKEIKLAETDLMICDAAAPLCLAGVFGGAESGVSENTTHIFLESAFFHPTYIRKSAARHQLRTDAAMHFEKTTDINSCVEALQRAALLILEVAGGEVASAITDIYPNPVKGNALQVSMKRINQLIGANLSEIEIKQILEKLEIKIENQQEDTLDLLVPTCKPEVWREADVVEEILRIYGLNSVLMPAQFRSILSPSPAVNAHQLEDKIASYLVGVGFAEIATNSISKSVFEKDEELKKQQVLLLNSQTAELDCMRSSMLYSGLEVIAHNQNRKATDLALFEFGKTYLKTANGYEHKKHLVLFLTGKFEVGSWLAKGNQADFFHLKSILQNLFKKLGIPVTSSQSSEKFLFDFAQDLFLEDNLLVTFGKISPSIALDLDVKLPVFFASVNWDLVEQRVAFVKTKFSELPKYQAVVRDLSLILDTQIAYEKVEKLAFSETKKLLKEVTLFDVYTGEKMEAGKKSYSVSFTFLDEQKTLTDADIDKAMNKLMLKYESELGAIIRKG